MSAVCYFTGSESRHYLYCSIFSTRLLNLNTETVHHLNVFVLFMSHFQALDIKQHLPTFCFFWTRSPLAKCFLITSRNISPSVQHVTVKLCATEDELSHFQLLSVCGDRIPCKAICQWYMQRFKLYRKGVVLKLLSLHPM